MQNIDGKKVLLDASNKYTTIGILPTNLLNWKGRLIKEDGSSEEIDLFPTKKSMDNCMMMVKVESNGKLNGKVDFQNQIIKHIILELKTQKLEKENYQEKLQNQLMFVQISEYNVENKTGNLTKPVVETFAFESDNHCEVIGNSMFINPLLFYTQYNNPFVLENRTNPIYFAYPREENL